MNEIRLIAEKQNDTTLLSNAFIEKFMPDANGFQVKLYLYLLYLLQGNRNFSVSTASDFLGESEKDVIKSLSYWEEAGLISIEARDNEFLCLSLNDPKELAPEAEIREYLVPGAEFSDKKELIFPVMGEEKEDDDAIRTIIDKVGNLLERCLGSADYSLICDLYEKMNFSSRLIIYLFQHCKDNGKTDIKYIEKVALDWADEGIRTVEQAEERIRNHSLSHNSVIKAFGLGRNLGQSEIQFLEKWQNTYHFPIDVIVAACDRTLIYKAKPDFKYADTILKNWYDGGCKNLEDAEKMNEAFSNAKKEQAVKAKKAPSSFPQRKYDEDSFKDMEKKLLNHK